MPKYLYTCDVSIVLRYLKGLGPLNDFSFKNTYRKNCNIVSPIHPDNFVDNRIGYWVKYYNLSNSKIKK